MSKNSHWHLWRLKRYFSILPKVKWLFLFILVFEVPALADNSFANLNPEARLLDGRSAWERWDLVAEFESGHFILANFWITNLGPGKHSGLAGGYIIYPDGQAKKWGNAQLRNGWTLSEDKRQLIIGDSQLVMRGSEYRLFVNQGDIEIELSFGLSGSMIPPKGTLPDGYNFETLALASVVKARVRSQDQSEAFEDLIGYAVFNHSWSSIDEAKFIPRIMQLLILEDERSVQLLDFASAEGQRYQWLGVVNRKEVLSSETDFVIELDGRASGVENFNSSRYWVPGNIQLKGRRIEGAIDVENMIAADELLKNLAQPIRFFVSLVTKPSRIWFDAPVDLSVLPGSDMPVIKFKGEELLIFSYVDAVPKIQ